MSFFKSIWHKYLGGKSTPWASIRYVKGRLSVEAYNKAFTDDLRSKLGDLTDDKDDAAVVQLYTDRENIEQEEPRLDVKHSGITDDGRIKMELDWNPSFIKHLAQNGIVAETEDEAVQMYLALLTHDVSDDMLPEGGGVTRDDVDAAFREIEEETKAELEIAAQSIADHNATKPRRKPRARKVT